MLEARTNFACLMDLLDVKSVDICKATGADKTLVSRWRSGKRRLWPENTWAGDVARALMEADAKRKGNALLEILRAYYPAEPLNTEDERLRALTCWLTAEGWKEAEYQRREGLFDKLMKKIEELNAPEPPPEHNPPASNPRRPVQTEAPPEPKPAPPLPNTAVYGTAGVQGTVLMCAELVRAMPEPQDILFVCPEGLEMFTRDMRFGEKLMDALMGLFAAGHRMSVVLRTDYRMTDVSLFSGRWLVAHLLGYIKSYYYDKFTGTYTDKMLAVVADKFVYRVVGENGEDEKIVTTVRFDKRSVEKAHEQCREYLKQSRQRFHYSLFEQPDGFLSGTLPERDRPCIQIARLPHFGVANEEVFQGNFQLSDEEMELLRREFPPLLWVVGRFDPDAAVRHIFCEDDIEDALLKARHVSQELSAITGRRVYMTTQRLAEQLVRMKTLLEEHKNYEVCFLRDDVFDKLTMQIMVHADRAALGWVAGGKSTACRDYTNVNALYGFCEAVWDRIPGVAKQRRAAVRKIDTWLKKARKYGLDV